MNHRFFWLASASMLALSLFATEIAFSNTIKTVKGNKILIEITEGQLQIGEEISIVGEGNKKVGAGKVTQVKGMRAIAEILSGSPQVGQKVEGDDLLKDHDLNNDSRNQRGQSGSNGGNTESGGGWFDSGGSKANTSGSNFIAKKNSWGIALSVLINSMNAQETNGTTTETAAMRGTGFGLFGYYDYAFTNRIALRMAGGFDQFKVSSTISINGCQSRTSNNCSTNINYLSGYGLLKYHITTGMFRVFAEGGMALMSAMSKSTTALKESDISTTSLFLIGGGVDIKLNGKHYIPLSFDYGLFPSSDSVSANSLIFRGGYAWLF